MGFLVSGDLKPIMFIPYVAMQCLASTFAAFLAKVNFLQFVLDVLHTTLIYVSAKCESILPVTVLKMLYSNLKSIYKCYKELC